MVFLINFIRFSGVMACNFAHWSTQCVEVLHIQHLCLSCSSCPKWLTFHLDLPWFLRGADALIRDFVSVVIQFRMFSRVASFLSLSRSRAQIIIAHDYCSCR